MSARATQAARPRRTSAVGEPLEAKAEEVDTSTRERLRQRLELYMAEKGLRSTNQRRIILDTFLEGTAHITIEGLLHEVRRRDEGIGYATVYRTLKLLTESGVASEHHFGDGLSRYELVDGAHTHHDHLICVSCGSITEFEEPRIEALQEEIARRHGFEVASHKHELYGRCGVCVRAGRALQSSSS
jgi:Fur family ferric uptake transcriptional regulator